MKLLLSKNYFDSRINYTGFLSEALYFPDVYHLCYHQIIGCGRSSQFIGRSLKSAPENAIS